MNKENVATGPDIEDAKCVVHLDGFGSIYLRCQFHLHFPRAIFANILAQKNFKPKTQLCNFWRKNIGAKILAQKCMCKMLMKLTL